MPAFKKWWDEHSFVMCDSDDTGEMYDTYRRVARDAWFAAKDDNMLECEQLKEINATLLMACKAVLGCHRSNIYYAHSQTLEAAIAKATSKKTVSAQDNKLIWEEGAEIAESIPKEIVAKLPKDFSKNFDKPHFTGKEILCPYCDKRWDSPSTASVCFATEECGCFYCVVLQHVLKCRPKLDESGRVWLELTRLKATNLDLLEAFEELLDCTCHKPCSCGVVEAARGCIDRARGEK